MYLELYHLLVLSFAAAWLPVSGSLVFAFIWLFPIHLTLVMAGYLTVPVTLVWWVLLGDDVYLESACGAFDDQFLGQRLILRFTLSYMCC